MASDISSSDFAVHSLSSASGSFSEDSVTRSHDHGHARGDTHDRKETPSAFVDFFSSALGVAAAVSLIVAVLSTLVAVLVILRWRIKVAVPKQPRTLPAALLECPEPDEDETYLELSATVA